MQAHHQRKDILRSNSRDRRPVEPAREPAREPYYIPVEARNHRIASNKEIQLLQPVLRSSEASDMSYCRDVREKGQLVSSTIEEATNRILASRRPRLIAVREQMSASAISLSVASQSQEEGLGSEASLGERFYVCSPIPDDPEDGGSLDSEYTEVTITSDEMDDPPPVPVPSSRPALRSDASAYTEVTVDEASVRRPSAQRVPIPLALSDGGSMPPHPTAPIMDESLLQSPLVLILEKRRQEATAQKALCEPRPTSSGPRSAQREVTIDLPWRPAPKDFWKGKHEPTSKEEDSKATDTIGTLPLSPGSSFDVTADAQPHHLSPKMIGRLGFTAHIPSASPGVPGLPLGFSPASMKTTRRENRKLPTAWENPPHHPFLRAPTSLSQSKGTTDKAAGVGAKGHVVTLPQTDPQKAVVPAKSTPTPRTSAAIVERRSRQNARPVVLASSTEIRPCAHRPRTVLVAQQGDNKSRSWSSRGRRNVPIFNYDEYHDDGNLDEDDDDRTAVSALTLDRRAYQVEAPLLIDTDAILDMLESTASTTAASTSSDSSVGSNRPARRPKRNPKAKTRTLAQSLGLVPRSRGHSKQPTGRHEVHATSSTSSKKAGSSNRPQSRCRKNPMAEV